METKDLNKKLEIKPVGGLKFRINSKMVAVMTEGCYSLFIEGLGYLYFQADDEPIPYVPRGGKKALQSIIDEGGLLDYNDIRFANPIKEVTNTENMKSIVDK